MKMKRRSCSLGFKVVFMIIFIMYFMQSCSSDTVISDDLFCMTVMTKSNDFIEPELTHKDSILVDSITKLDEVKSYAMATRQLIKKIQPLMESDLWDKEPLGEYQNRKDSINALVLKISKHKDIQNDWNSYVESYKSFIKLMENAQLSSTIKTILVVKVITSSDD